MKKIIHTMAGVLLSLLAVGSLSACQPQNKSSQSAVSQTSQKKATSQKRAVQAKIKDNTYQFTRLPKQNLDTPYRFTTAVGEFTTGEAYLSGYQKNKDNPQSWDGFKIDFTYKNTTNKPQNPVKAFQSVFKVQTMHKMGGQTNRVIKPVTTFAAYVGMDPPRHEEDVKRIANRSKTVQPGESIDTISAFGATDKQKQDKKAVDDTEANYTVAVLADPKSDVVLQQVTAKINWRFD
ncbi:hypothetical protein [Schleiferilactobacillus perolens]|uniref:DUF5067 domain-containing protein n=1 Tax=Schleiferilactobacillus perolens DSM 12744 TaxID=1423792 RepID=A0A0R1N2X6_9LACO|nr:hypothetical protein [Schleiferilactobacillus perolens]KRL11075.1 hypothetical protein FD09_GL000800 [Schleiferilactobacillus perolens DSM 12744]